MVCPKCEEGEIIQVKFKKNKKGGYVCNYCMTIWMENENINSHTGGNFDAVIHDIEYKIDYLDSRNPEDQSVEYVKCR